MVAMGLGALATGACGSAEAPRAEPDVATKQAVDAPPAKPDVATKPAVDASPAEPATATKQVVATPPAEPDAATKPVAPAVAPSRLGIPPNPEHAVMIVGGNAEPGIVVLDASQEPVGRLVTANVSWCRVDPRAGVVWYQHRPLGEAAYDSPVTLSFVDLEGHGPPVVVIDESPDVVVIQYPDEVLGRPEPHGYEDGIAVRMDEPPQLEAILGCDGDMAYYCFGEEVTDIEAAHAKRLAERRKALARAPFVGAEAVAALVARARLAGRRAVPTEPPRGPEPTTVKAVPRAGCDASPEECGKARRLPGTPYWQVVVSNSRGDFYHESRGLYDPVEKVFFDPKDATARSPKPVSDEPFLPTWVSPSGERAMDDSTLVKLAGGTLATDMNGACGFWGGGWENASSGSSG